MPWRLSASAKPTGSIIRMASWFGESSASSSSQAAESHHPGSWLSTPAPPSAKPPGISLERAERSRGGTQSRIVGMRYTGENALDGLLVLVLPGRDLVESRGQVALRLLDPAQFLVHERAVAPHVPRFRVADVQGAGVVGQGALVIGELVPGIGPVVIRLGQKLTGHRLRAVGDVQGAGAVRQGALVIGELVPGIGPV